MAHLVVAAAAQSDLIDIQFFGIVNFGQRASDDYAEGLRRLMGRLADFPMLGAERRNLLQPVRVLPYRSHLVIYTFEDDVVRILRVRHGREDWFDNPTGDDP